MSALSDILDNMDDKKNADIEKMKKEEVAREDKAKKEEQKEQAEGSSV